ncbi:class I SAM-dependent DNA methyltransferase [Methylocella sp.]|uniref:class I SAM-dependent DNA methyltransferase n=1 Tax=Methylocella sp. TaxID=1978226 RepID=UPI003784A1DF
MADLSDCVIPHYERHAHAWDADRRRSVWNDKPWRDRFVAALPTGASVLDPGCGSGAPVALNMAVCGLAVTGVDASPSLISLCRQRTRGHQWVVGDMRSPPIRGRFDGVLAWDSFFHFTPGDQRRMFQVFAEHGRRQSILMFNAGPAHGEAIGNYRGDPLRHASLDPAEYGSLLDGIGFDVVAHAVEDREAGGRTVWLARSRA